MFQLEDVLNEKQFQKVKKFLEENGKQPAHVISENTGVRLDKIDTFLRQGRLEIPEGEGSYIHCKVCGIDIRYGTYCPACAAQLSKEIQAVLSFGEVGVIPKMKTIVKSEQKEENRFIGINRHL